MAGVGLALGGCSGDDSAAGADAGGKQDATAQGDASGAIDAGSARDASDASPIDSGVNASDAADASSPDADAGTPDAASLACPSGFAGPPADPHGPAATSATSVVYAVSSWQLGDGPTGSEWKSLGFDIDGKATTGANYDGCSPASGGSKARLADGPCAIDNSFGENVASLISAIASNPSTNATLATQAGASTMLLKIAGLPSPLASTSKISAALYGAGKLGAPAKFDGTDVWPVDEASVAGGDVGKPLLTFDAGYVTGSTFVSGPSTGTTSVYLAMKGGPAIILPLTHVVVQLDLSSDGATITRGTLSGIVPTEALVDGFRQMAGTINTLLCDPASFDQLATSIRGAQDILPDGTNPSTATCGAISIGLGFTGHADKMGAPTTLRPSDTCSAADASTD
jgi:hypothetical protein